MHIPCAAIFLVVVVGGGDGGVVVVVIVSECYAMSLVRIRLDLWRRRRRRPLSFLSPKSTVDRVPLRGAWQDDNDSSDSGRCERNDDG